MRVLHQSLRQAAAQHQEINVAELFE